MDEAKDPKAILAGTFEVSLTLSTTRSMKINGYIFAGETVEQLNARITSMQEVVEHQAIRADVINKEAQKDAMVQSLELGVEHIKDLAEKKKANVKLNTQQRLSLDRSETDIRNVQSQIASLDAAIKAGRAKLNGAAPPSA